MVTTITPVVHGRRRSRYALSVLLHSLGAVLSAGALGALLGGAGFALGAPWGIAGAAVLAAVALLYAAREWLGAPIPLPERRAQVPGWWRTFYSPPVTAFLYGVGLGPGFLTHMGHGTFAAVALVALASGDPLLGVAVCAPFGLVRGLSVLAGRVGGRDPGGADELDRLERLAAGPAPRVANGLALSGLALASIAAL